jgi:hypothetical protein
MGNHLVIATVTAALRQFIQNALNADGLGATAQVGRPEAVNGHDLLVNLFLYQVVPNAAARNVVMPSRGGDGRSHGLSAVAVDLHYLISFSGAAKTYDPERLLGSVALALEHQPLITRTLVDQVVHDDSSLAQPDLTRAAEVPRAYPLNLSLDEMSKLWSVFFQVPYLLSVAYSLGCVFVETGTAGSPGPPVTRVGIGALPMDGPAIAAIEAADGPFLPIVWGGKIAVKGRGLLRADLKLRMAGHDVALGTAVTPERIELTLSAATLGDGDIPAGPVLVQAVIPPAPGAPIQIERITDGATFLLRPTLILPPNALAVAGKITVNVTPKVRDGQIARLLLDERVAVTPVTRQFAPDPVPANQFPVGALTFSVPGLRHPSSYYVQLMVDGVASPPIIDLDASSPTFRQITGPTVTIP